MPVASGRGHDAAIHIAQRDAVLWAGRLQPGEVVTVPDAKWVHLFVRAWRRRARGRRCSGEGDAVRLTGAGSLTLTAESDGAEVLVWQMG